MEKITSLVDTLRNEYGVGSVCHERDIALSTYYRHQHYRRLPEKRSRQIWKKRTEVELATLTWVDGYNNRR